MQGQTRRTGMTGHKYFPQQITGSGSQFHISLLLSNYCLFSPYVIICMLGLHIANSSNIIAVVFIIFSPHNCTILQYVVKSSIIHLVTTNNITNKRDRILVVCLFANVNTALTIYRRYIKNLNISLAILFYYICVYCRTKSAFIFVYPSRLNSNDFHRDSLSFSIPSNFRCIQIVENTAHRITNPL